MDQITPIYCCGCGTYMPVISITGSDAYPHRPDLSNLKFFKCTGCSNFVGTHKNTGKPLGTIPTAEVKKYRSELHKLIDPIWKHNSIKRSAVYAHISKELGYVYHSAEVNNKEMYLNTVAVVNKLIQDLEATFEYHNKKH